MGSGKAKGKLSGPYTIGSGKGSKGKSSKSDWSREASEASESEREASDNSEQRRNGGNGALGHWAMQRLGTDVSELQNVLFGQPDRAGLLRTMCTWAEVLGLLSQDYIERRPSDSRRMQQLRASSTFVLRSPTTGLH